MPKIVERNGRYAILKDRKDTFAVCWQDAFSWKYKARGLSLGTARELLAVYAS